MISRIVSLSLLVAASSVPDQAPPIPTFFSEVGTSKFLTVDLTKPQPEATIAPISAWLESEMKASNITPPRKDEILLAQGLIELERQHFGTAAAILAGLPATSLLSDAALFYRSQALRLTGEGAIKANQSAGATIPCREARDHLHELLDFPSSVFRDLQTGEYRKATLCYIRGLTALKRPSETRNLIFMLLKDGNDLESADREFLQTTLIGILKRDNQLEEARALWEKTRDSFPRNRELSSLESGLPPLPPPSRRPSYKPEVPELKPREPEEDALFSTAVRLLNRKESKEAIELLVKIQRDYSGSIAARKAAARLRTVATSYFAQPRPPAYFVKNAKRLPPDFLYSLARSIWEDEHDKPAQELFEHIIETSPTYPQAGNVYYFLGRIAENRGAWKDARAYFEKVVNEHSGSNFYDRCHFKVGWLSYVLNDDKKAKEWLEADRAKVQDTTLITQDLYWLAKVHERMGNSAEAKRYLDSIPKVAPLSFYSFLADRLPSLYDPGPIKDYSPRNPWNVFRFDRARAFLSAGVPFAAAAVVKEIDLDPDPGAQEYVATLFAYSGSYSSAFPLGAILATPDPNGAVSRRILEILFPRPMEPIVRAEAAANGIDPLLIYALIKQESAFREDAESRTGAVGLMQLMPDTAKLAARELNEPSYDRSVLAVGPRNIKFGAHYLGSLVKHYSGNIILALAAYNAGTNHVDAWIARWKELPPEAFIEFIPFEETRNYVKAISRNFSFYAKMLENRTLHLSDLVPAPKT